MTTKRSKKRNTIKKRTIKRNKKQSKTKKAYKKRKNVRKKSLKKNKRKTCGGMNSNDDDNNSGSSETSTLIENIRSNNEEQNAEIDFIPNNVTDKERFLHQASNTIQNLKNLIIYEMEYDGNARGQSPVLEDIDPREMRYLKELPDKLQIDGTNIFSPGTPGHESILNSYQEMETREQIQYLTKVYERIINSYIELLVRTTDSTNESSPVRSRRFRQFRMLQLEPLRVVREIRNNRLSDTDIRSRA